MTTPEELEVGRRNLLAQLRQLLERDKFEYTLTPGTARDLVEVLEGLAPADAYPGHVHNTTHPVGRRSATGIHHADDCPMRNFAASGCVCGREGERETKP